MAEGKEWKLGELFERLWYLRGFVAGASFLGIASLFGDLSQWEAARIIHAIGMDWNNLLNFIGGSISGLLFLPVLDALLLNIFIVISASVAPYHWDMLNTEGKKPIKIAIGVVGFTLFYTLVLYFVTSEWLTLIERRAKSGQFSTEIIGFINLNEIHSWLWVGVIAMFASSMVKLRSYRRGLVHFVAFLLTIELAYFAPFVGDHLESYADGVLGTERESD